MRTLLSIVVLCILTTSAHAVPVAMQRSGTFTTGDGVPGDWNIMLFFDSDDIQDDFLTTPEVSDFMIATSANPPFIGATYDATDTLFTKVWNIEFLNGIPVLDTSELVSVDVTTNQFFGYAPVNTEVTEVSNFPSAIQRHDFITGSVPLTQVGNWWSFKSLTTSPAVPEPVTSTLLIVGTLALARRQRVA